MLFCGGPGSSTSSSGFTTPQRALLPLVAGSPVAPPSLSGVGKRSGGLEDEASGSSDDENDGENDDAAMTVEFDKDGKAFGVTSEGETTKCKKLVSDPSYLPNKVQNVGRVARLC
ncbi:hypothetical protein J5N97_028343 [Dioscorea zingiberensis]|uniref:Uncharacterized protein n=1 Tax=Dioscorea zingiberensis TaxID=325984 RepID=A0A9D5BYY4_9LILI|nr:hypothetical protein J5N97_028343 [Dioscorea zingiberensis]